MTKNKSRFPEPLPEGWTLQRDEPQGLEYVTYEDNTYGEHGCIAHAEWVGGYMVPGASGPFQGPFPTFEAALASVEGHDTNTFEARVEAQMTRLAQDWTDEDE